MKTTKTLGLVTAALGLTAALALPAVAADPQGRGQGRGSGIGMRGGPVGPGAQGMPPGRMGPGAEPMQMLRGLALTDAQREQIRAIQQEARGARDGRRGMELERQLQAALLADVPDQQRIAELKQAIAAAHAEALNHRIDVQARVFQVLTPEQRAQLRQRADARGTRK